MTTQVQVTVAGHKVKVTTLVASDESGNSDSSLTLEVQGQTTTYYAHSGQAIRVEELEEKSHTAMSEVNTAGKISDVTEEQLEPYRGQD